ncbi:glucan phosphoethanolaminetransferase (alkaline phosphatase superfamily) [Paenibacillus sp. V4I3]|nr:glucan phosphoethanolaminetransferase (alkaline phosphatase superfamily) [Paenibacillus sp. V4I3]MDQ0888323.1 glucan phosphoethanolaminetransferase (alkaline phosphatase superfamily) [Paenibacillus sp. V4I9]
MNLSDKTYKNFPPHSLKLIVLFISWYGLTFAFAALSYPIFSSVPYDRSITKSGLYYGFLFSVIPYFSIGSWVRKQSYSNLIFAWFSLLFILFIDKFVIIYMIGIFANLTSLSHDFFLQNAYDLACEELPFYCHPMIYLAFGTLLAAASYLTAFLMKENPIRR